MFLVLLSRILRNSFVLPRHKSHYYPQISSFQVVYLRAAWGLIRNCFFVLCLARTAIRTRRAGSPFSAAAGRSENSCRDLTACSARHRSSYAFLFFGCWTTAVCYALIVVTFTWQQAASRSHDSRPFNSFGWIVRMALRLKFTNTRGDDRCAKSRP